MEQGILQQTPMKCRRPKGNIWKTSRKLEKSRRNKFLNTHGPSKLNQEDLNRCITSKETVLKKLQP
jgi:hypothetical protein